MLNLVSPAKKGQLVSWPSAVLPGRMRRSVDLLQLAKRNLGVDLSRPDIGVAEHLLNEPNVGSIFMHQRSECVPKQVTRAGLSDFRLQNVSADEIVIWSRLMACPSRLRNNAELIETLDSCGRPARRYRATHRDARFPTGTYRSRLPFPLRTSTSPRSNCKSVT